MESVLRALAIYLILMLIFRITGKRSLAQITTFDFVLLLVIGEATQNALLGDDFSITNAVVIIVTLVVADIAFSKGQQRFPRLDRWLDDAPLLLVEHGRLLQPQASRSRLTEADILQAARLTQGLERMDQVKYAVLERTGEVSIIPVQDNE